MICLDETQCLLSLIDDLYQLYHSYVGASIIYGNLLNFDSQ